MPEPMPNAVFGVDIAKHTFAVARLCENHYRHKQFDNTVKGFVAFLDWIKTFDDAPQP